MDAFNQIGSRSQRRDTFVPIAKSEFGKQVGFQQERIGMPGPDTILRADKKSGIVR
jgi:hypothetical protein